MVIQILKSPNERALTPRRLQAGLMIELVLALALLLGAFLPLAFSLGTEKRLARSLYQRAVAIEIVDGELEILAAGEWRSFGPGRHDYEVNGWAFTNLPPGKFNLTITESVVRLEWVPGRKHAGGAVVREAKLR